MVERLIKTLSFITKYAFKKVLVWLKMDRRKKNHCQRISDYLITNSSVLFHSICVSKNEIVDATGLNMAIVDHHLKNLHKNGLVVFDNTVPRRPESKANWAKMALFLNHSYDAIKSAENQWLATNLVIMIQDDKINNSGKFTFVDLNKLPMTEPELCRGIAYLVNTHLISLHPCFGKGTFIIHRMNTEDWFDSEPVMRQLVRFRRIVNWIWS